MASFPDRPLDTQQSIRLVSLHHGHVDDPIVCDILQVSLDDDPKYTTLSYAWGDHSQRRDILCGGLEFWISSSLFDALQQFRRPDEELILWADQLCINQLDLEERNHQVGIMAKIYKSSQRCLAFIGKATEADVEALALMHKVVEHPWHESHSIGVQDTEDLNLPKRSDVKWQHLRNLMARPWFSRVWVIQEAVLPPACNIFVGRYSFKLSSVKTFVEVIHANSLGAMLTHGLGPDERDAWLRTLTQIANLTSFLPSETRRSERSFARILHRSRVAASSDPRDKVFGILGLSTFDPGVVPDYGLSVQEVYRRTAIALITNGDGLETLFTAAANSRKGVEGLPSWVPDWRKVDILSEAWFQAYHDCRYYKPNGTKAANMQVLADPTCVTIRGGFVDSIVQQTEVFYGQSTDDVLMITKQMLEWWAVAERVFLDFGSYPTGESGFHAFWQTLMGGNQEVADVQANPRDETGPKVLQRVRVFLLPLDIVRSVLDTDADQSWYEAYNAALQDMDVAEVSEQVYPKALYIPLSALPYQVGFWGTCHARRFCTTSKGYFGVVPQQARPGDRICMFPDERLPFLLRSREDLKSYEAIGRCYVHGLSDGKAWKRDGFMAEDIVIS